MCPGVHFNSLNPGIQFTTEGEEEEGALAFMDTLQKEDGSLKVTMYVEKAPTHVSLPQLCFKPPIGT